MSTGARDKEICQLNDAVMQRATSKGILTHSSELVAVTFTSTCEIDHP